MTTVEEWRAIDWGICVAVNRAFAAVELVRRETGETFEAACRRLLVKTPVAEWERGTMMSLMRR